MKGEEKSFYAGIEEPIEVRRSLLEASKEIIQSLQRYEKIKEIRENKIKEINKLKKILKEINSLNSGLKEAFPGENLRAEKEGKAIRPKVAKKSGLEKLEMELSEVERELNKLG